MQNGFMRKRVFSTRGYQNEYYEKIPAEKTAKRVNAQIYDIGTVADRTQ